MFVMLKIFYKSKFGTKAIRQFIIIKLKSRLAVIRPLVMIRDYE